MASSSRKSVLTRQLSRADSVTSTTSNLTFSMDNMTSTTSTLFNKNIDKEGLAMRQTKLFKFTTNTFMNTYYNIVVECWADAINDRAIPMILAELNLTMGQVKKSVNGGKLEELRKLLLNRLFQNGKLDMIFKRAQDFADKTLFYIPPNIVVDEEDQENAIALRAASAEDEDRLWEEIAELEQEILLLRVQIQYVNSENEKAQMCLEFAEKMEMEEADDGAGRNEG